MHGNVWEWFRDFKSDYKTGEISDPFDNKNGTLRIRRGGSWRSGARLNRSSFRGCLKPDGKLDYLGFCLALVPID